MSRGRRIQASSLCLLVGVNLGCSESASTEEAMGGAGGENNSEASLAIEFSNLRAEEVEAASATIRFVTSIETTCEVEYGTSPDNLHMRATDPAMDPDNPYDIDHNVPLEDLPPDSVIYYRARAESPSDEFAYSEVLSFRTKEEASQLSPFENWENVALLDAGVEITAVSSNYGSAKNNGSFGANSAIDGQMGTEWATASDGSDAWLEIDLGQKRVLAGISFRSREMSDGSSIIKSFELLVDDGVTLGPFLTPDPSVNYEFVLDNAVEARSVRLLAIETSGGNTGIKELGLFTSD
jgi:hypothetical protein